MPYVTAAYLNYLEQVAGGGGTQAPLPPPDIPPAMGGDEPTTAPFGPPGQGGPGSYPAAPPPGMYGNSAPLTYGQYFTQSPFFPPGVTFMGQDETQGVDFPAADPGATPSTAPDLAPSLGGPGSYPAYPSSPTPYQPGIDISQNPFATPSDASFVNISTGEAPPTDQLPAPPGVTPASAYPQYATSGMMGYPPALPVGGQVNLGGWGQPAGYFGVPTQGPIGAYGVGGTGGSFYGGGIQIAPGAAGGAISPGALAYGLGPLPGTPSQFGGGGSSVPGGAMPGSYSAIIGFHTPQFQQWMAQNNINPQEMLAALTGGGSQPAADVSGAMHAGAGPKGAQ